MQAHIPGLYTSCVVFPDADPKTLTTVAMHVLVAEDDRILGDGLKVGLEQLGWAVDLVRDGTGAQTALEADEMDLVVLDLGLPRKSGIEILRWLRARGYARSLILIEE